MAGRAQGWKLRRDKRTGLFLVRFRNPTTGRRIQRSTGTADPVEAAAAAAKIYNDEIEGRSQRMRARTLTIVTNVDPLDVLAAQWLAAVDSSLDPQTIETYGGYVRAHWMPAFRTLARLTEEACREYIRDRLRHVQAETVRKECSALRGFVAWLLEEKILRAPVVVPPVPASAVGVRTPGRSKAVRYDYTAEEMERTLAKLPERSRRGHPARAYYTVMWETGLRRETLRELSEPENYYPGRPTLRVLLAGDKNRMERELPLTPAARAALDSACTGGGKLFTCRDLVATLRKAARAAGIDEARAAALSNHDFRHARITHWTEHSTNLPGIQYLAGHKHATTTARYVKASQRAASQVLDSIRDTSPGHKENQEKEKPS